MPCRGCGRCLCCPLARWERTWQCIAAGLALRLGERSLPSEVRGPHDRSTRVACGQWRLRMSAQTVDEDELAAGLRRELAWQFSLCPSSYCHASWLPAGLTDADLPGRHEASHACHRYLAPWLSEQYGLDRAALFDFQDPLRRLALLDTGALERLAPVFGLLACVKLLRRTLDGLALARIREACQLEELGFIAACGIDLPPQPKAEAHALDEEFLSRLPNLGRIILLTIAGAGEPALAARMRMKFPKQPSLRTRKDGDTDDATSRRLAGWLADECIPRTLPPWTWLFC